MQTAPSSDPHVVHPIAAGRHRVVALLAFVFLAEAAGIGAAFTADGRAWYAHLHQPSFAPPDWVFAPVWTVLYAAIGVSAWFVWQRHRSWQRDVALRWWAAQLLLNAAWAPLSFGARHPAWALVDVVALFVVAAVTCVRFLPLDRRASALFVPYLAWLAFALTLNAAVVARN